VEKTNSVRVQWRVDNQNNIARFECEKSYNGIHFTKLSDHFLNPSLTYFSDDLSPNIGVTFYRIKIISSSGEVHYSRVIRTYFGIVENSILIFPNPGSHILQVRLVAVLKGDYQVQAFDNLGRLLADEALWHDGTDKTISFRLNEVLASGIYRLILMNKSHFYKQNFLIK
jgi:hypothetical protein